MSKPTHNKPLATKGLKSYRYKGRYGYIMIGANSTKEALSKAAKSTSDVDISNLQIYVNFVDRYLPVKSS